MSDKELIKQEIESYKESMKGLKPHSDFRRGQLTAYNQIMQFIDSLPEEPKKQPKYKVGDTIKGPCNNIFQVKEVLDKQYVLHSENGDELNSIEIVDANSCIVEESSCDKKDYRERYKRIAQTEQFKSSYCDKSLGKEEPVSEDVKEEIKHYIQSEFPDGTGFPNVPKIARYFAEWQKQQMMKDAVIAWVNTYESVTNPYDNEVSFITNLSPSKFKNKEMVKIIIVKEQQ